ncbi:protein-L-isoaspartate O-methyltransferase family protein [Bdellovibrio bacteriovorus]|uniref:Protein-L-isoaspartate O-methyltransferase n=1 Tax=Bdellovibrio bacteriovorus str. Tiberius TaxID=1069642 RepID=K7YQQ7_BDEBC|nr:protein-L-isoaspartate O-methyltransferase [Bdellovibrio bacteriovorus]AFY02216.1 L-isoaspartyl protein carboxyl methyltransferase [Bdellovibrio bacteriovorus str. Tiberius]
MGLSLEHYQQGVLKRALPLSEKVVEAFYSQPRHVFVPEYTVEEAYEDHPLVLFNSPPFVSTISQPSFVLRILDLLKLEPGQKVFELGTGSGWNTAMMAEIVGKEGKVVSVEVIEELAVRARKILSERHLSQVIVKAGDGFEGDTANGPYDRVIFTAGSSEFPQKVFAQLKESGWMVFVRKTQGSPDMLELIHKVGSEPHVVTSVPCSFVSVVREKTGPDSKEHSL